MVVEDEGKELDELMFLNSEIESLKLENQKLKEEIEEAKYEKRKAKRRLDEILNSKRYRFIEYCMAVFHNPLKIIKLPQKIFIIIKRNLVNYYNDKKYVSTSSIETISEKEKKNVLLPIVNEVDFINVFDNKSDLFSVSIIICVHNALQDVAECLNSLWEHRTFPYKIIIINDGSDVETSKYLEKYAAICKCQLICNEVAQGYTKSANIGLRRALDSDYIVLLNSDTIVTSGWLEKMLNVFIKYPKTGIVSPLSNAASYQSVPEHKDILTGDWKINSLPEDMNVEMMAYCVEISSKCIYPEVEVLNGFCFMISKQVINSIGYLDEENFPKGYGEEVDFCIRTKDVGFQLRVVDDTYIFHEKSKSFTHKTRKELGKIAKDILKEKHQDMYLQVGQDMESEQKLDYIRLCVKNNIVKIRSSYHNLIGKKIAFLLTAKGGSGGANSICQEVMGMRRFNVEAFIINSSNYKDEFECNYPELTSYVRYFNKNNIETLINQCKNFDVIIATIFTTVNLLEKVKIANDKLKIGYYIQDYEPLFFDKGSDYWIEAKKSYNLIPNMFYFAKTKWIIDEVEKKHNIKVSKVTPSIDNRIYNPWILKCKKSEYPIVITAMIRPKTERRNPIGTMKVLKKVVNDFGARIQVKLFGCTDDELKAIEIFFEYENKGILKRWEVAQLLASTDIFLDLSTYQAFGRTGLESMCLGCVPVIPLNGGVDEYALNGVNAVITDSVNEKETYIAIKKLIDNRDNLLKMQKEGLETAKRYNTRNSAWSEIELFNSLFT